MPWTESKPVWKARDFQQAFYEDGASQVSVVIMLCSVYQRIDWNLIETSMQKGLKLTKLS